MVSEEWGVLLEVIDALEALGIPFHLGGSFASAIHGVPRQTRDADLVADLSRGKVAGLVSRLEAGFYVSREMIEDAIEARSSFNVVHYGTSFKVDLFVLGDDPFDREEFRRSIPIPLGEGHPRLIPVKSPEDTILRKLQWFEAGGRVSERQWTDVQGILRTQGDRLDTDHLRRWAATLGIAGLLADAIREAAPGSA